jgi:hypothetical protein
MRPDVHGPAAHQHTVKEASFMSDPKAFLITVASASAAVYALWWLLGIPLALILGLTQPDLPDQSGLYHALRGFYSDIPFAWPLVSFGARIYYYNPFGIFRGPLYLFDLFGPAPPHTVYYQKAELLAMVTITLILVGVGLSLGILAVRARRRRSATTSLRRGHLTWPTTRP